jgi:hypothetical protein
LLDATSKFLGQEANISIRLEARNGSQLPTHQIRDHDVSSRRANIDANDAAFSRIDIEKRWFSAAADGLSHCPFKNQGFIQQFTYQQAGDTTSHIHQPCQIGT